MKDSERGKQLSVIIVNHNGKSDLERCLRSLAENCDNIICEIIVVDNNSSDGSREMVADQFPQASLIFNSENRGFPAANNQGIRASRGNYLLFLNPDTEVYPQSLEILIAGLRDRPEAGGMGPALLTGDNEYQVSFGSRVGFFSQFLQKCCLNHYYRRHLKKSVKIRDVGWLSGACLLIRREVMEEVGLFDESFFLYFEDIDLCYRIREKGWKLCFFPESKMFHQGGVSTGKKRLASRFFYRKSQLYFYTKHCSKISLNLLRFYLRVNFICLVLFGVLHREKDFPAKHHFFALLREKSLPQSES